MLRTIFKTFFKVLLALGAVFGVVALLQYLDDQKADYIEIYNDDGLDGEYF
ncbi:hypothetical protein LJC60_03380 [Ruminococcaceae bacterium OttesenSCG-928-D13]|nr:hypothetical protein [Ruminococcaceae bacterium OttesenSCG-928-D13]